MDFRKDLAEKFLQQTARKENGEGIKIHMQKGEKRTTIIAMRGKNLIHCKVYEDDMAKHIFEQIRILAGHPEYRELIAVKG